MFYTIGYQGLSVVALQDIVTRQRIDTLIDLRTHPMSRWNHDFDKKNLVAAFGQSYCWKGKLLGGKHGPVPEEGIDYLCKIQGKKTYLLMCMEADPLKCHRFSDIGLRLAERGIECIHVIHEKDGLHFITTSDLKRSIS